jgi:hypothetical protein
LTSYQGWFIDPGMAKKQTRRSVSLSKSTYERLKAYCEVNALSMSQFVEQRVGDFLGRSPEKADNAPDDKKTAGQIFTF